MFPAGAAGYGLMLLRVSAAGMLVRSVSANSTVPISTWEIAGVVLLAAALCLGAFTPVGCCLAALVESVLVLQAHEPDPFQFVFSFSVTAAVFLLGPGAFSLDSRLFGRRLIVRSDSSEVKGL